MRSLENIKLIYICIFCVHISCGQTEINYSDKLLTSSFKTYEAADIEMSDHILPFLKKRFIEELENPNSFNNPYDSLSKHVSIKHSKDRLLKLYCFIERNYGCRWLSSTFVQFKTMSGDIKTVAFDEIATGIDEDLYITDLQQIEINNQSHYLVIGIGGHCGNHKYATARVYKILNDTMVLCDAIFGNESEINANSNRSREIEMKYDIEAKTLSYNEYVFDDHYGFYSDEKSIKTWSLKKKGFRLVTDEIKK